MLHRHRISTTRVFYGGTGKSSHQSYESYGCSGLSTYIVYQPSSKILIQALTFLHLKILAHKYFVGISSSLDHSVVGLAFQNLYSHTCRYSAFRAFAFWVTIPDFHHRLMCRSGLLPLLDCLWRAGPYLLGHLLEALHS